MSLPTFDSAKDEILSLFNTYWTANAGAVNGGIVPPIEWPGVDSEEPPSPDITWVRITILNNLSEQSTLNTPGNRRFTRSGIITIQVFVPLRGLTTNNPVLLCEKLSIIARDSYEGNSTASGIWFKNATIREVGSDRDWYQFNISVEFSYDEMK